MTATAIDAIQRLATANQLGVTRRPLQGRIGCLTTALPLAGTLPSRWRFRPELEGHAHKEHSDVTDSTHAADYTPRSGT